MPESTDTLGSLMDEAVQLAERTACLAEENARTLRELVERHRDDADTHSRRV